MKHIAAPLARGVQGPNVVDLQSALKLFLEHRMLLPQGDATGQELFVAIEREIDARVYG